MRSGNFGNAFADKSMRDDELRFSVVPLFRNVQRIEKLLHVLAIDFLNVEAISLEAFASIFTLRLLRRRIQGDRVGIVDDDQIIETEMSREGARFRCNTFLHVTVARETNNMLVEDSVLGGVETACRHFCRHRDADRVTDALSQRTSGAFHSGSITKFRMARRFAV